MLPVINMPDLVEGVHFFTPPPLPPRDPRFVRGPSELCTLAMKWDGTVSADGLIVQEKVDGIRAVFYEGRLWTRSGNSIGGVDHIVAVLIKLEQAFGRRMFLDGEFQVDGALRPTLRHFANGGRYGDAGRIFLFDAVPLEDWRADRCQMPLRERLEALDAAAATLVDHPASVLPWRLCASPGAVQTEAAAVWTRGGEGLVAKAPNSVYRRRRESAWMKVKQ